MGKFQIKEYTLAISNDQRCWMRLKDVRGRYLAILDFTFPDGGNVQESGNQIHVYMRSDSFEKTVDILRNEKPVFFHWTPSFAALTTNYEPVGEGESEVDGPVLFEWEWVDRPVPSD